MRPSPAAFPNPALLGLAVLSLAAGTWANPETLTFVKGEAETLHVYIDYDRHPGIASESGLPWEEIEKDSVYTTGTGADETRHVRYVKAFYAEMNGRKGFGTDYIHFTGPAVPSADRDPVYTAECTFLFPNGSSHERLYNMTVHLNDFHGVSPEYQKGVALGTPFGLGNGEGEDVPVELVARSPGWDLPVTAGPVARPGAVRGGAGWMVRLDGRQALRVPEGTSRVRLLDVTGRSAWRAGGLRPGEELALPADLGPGAFRYQWIP